MEDDEGQSLEVVRQKGIGLFMIRIDDMDLDDFTDFVNDFPESAAVYDKTSDAYLQWQENARIIESCVERIKEKGEYDIYEKDAWTKACWQQYWQHQHDFVNAFMAKKRGRAPKRERSS